MRFEIMPGLRALAIVGKIATESVKTACRKKNRNGLTTRGRGFSSASMMNVRRSSVAAVPFDGW